MGRSAAPVIPNRITIVNAAAIISPLLSSGIVSTNDSRRPVDLDLRSRREVDTRGYVACDTHIHTLTYSGHGDSTALERVVTLAGEGIELPITTEHNVHTDYRPSMREAGVEGWFTPVIGN